MSENNHSQNNLAFQKKSIWKLTQRLIRKLRRGSTVLHRDDLVEGLITEDNAHADSFDDDEKRLLKNILTLRQRHVEDVMVRRAQISAIDVVADMDEVRQAFETTQHSRLPVYRGTLDQPIGIVHIKDVFRLFAKKNQANFDLEKIVHPPLFVPPSMKVVDLLRKMQEQKLHMALVIDEHGGTYGLVSIEDLVEEIVGEIEDEHEKKSRKHRGFVKRRDGSIEVNGHISLGELKKILGRDLAEGKNTNETLGALATALLGHLPQKNERIMTASGMVIEIRATDMRRIRTVRVYPPQGQRFS